MRAGHLRLCRQTACEARILLYLFTGTTLGADVGFRRRVITNEDSGETGFDTFALEGIACSRASARISAAIALPSMIIVLMGLPRSDG